MRRKKGLDIRRTILTKRSFEEQKSRQWSSSCIYIINTSASACGVHMVRVLGDVWKLRC